MGQDSDIEDEEYDDDDQDDEEDYETEVEILDSELSEESYVSSDED